jgi:hypothetical protein
MTHASIIMRRVVLLRLDTHARTHTHLSVEDKRFFLPEVIEIVITERVCLFRISLRLFVFFKIS